jgi:hypothetical protein
MSEQAVQYGVISHISPQQVVQAAKVRMGILGDNTADPIIEYFVQEGVRHTDTSLLLVKKPVKLCIENGIAELPCDYKQFISLVLLKETDSNADGGNNDNCQPILYVDRGFLASCECDGNSPQFSDYMSSFEIIDDKIKFHRIDDSVTSAMLTYQGFNVDGGTDFIAIHPDYERGVASYAAYMYMMAFPEAFSQQTFMVKMGEFKKTWLAQKKWLSSQAAIKNFNENKYYIRNLMNAMLTPKNEYWK